MKDLSVLIPARNEMFLARTIQDILEHAESDFEVIAVLDGQWTAPPIPQHERVTVLYFPESIGQRAATNAAARISKGKYLIKCDAHCAFDQGFDVKLMADMQPDWTLLPVMRNLHAFNWVCKNGHKRYQGPSGPCSECGEPTERDVIWYPKPSPQSTAYRFDNTLHFQYWPELRKKQGEIAETLSIQGSFFMVAREKYFELNLCDENFGSWGQQGVEVACKTWLSGGRVMVSKKTWYAHMFRTQGGDFGFPYPNPGIAKAREYSRNLFLNNLWEKQIHPLSWLLDKFAPVPDWHDDNGKEALAKVMEAGRKYYEAKSTNLAPKSTVSAPKYSKNKGIVYYTDNRLDQTIMQACQNQLRNSVNGHRIVSVGLQKMNFGDNITLSLERGYLTMFRQILAGLEELDSDVVFLCEHDVLYHPSHFSFVPPSREVYYYNTNVWKIDRSTGHALYYFCKQTSGLCAYRELLVRHYRERVRRVEQEGFSRSMGFEPGSHNRPERVDDYKSEVWQSEYPNLDIRHGQNLTPSRWRQDQFRSQRNCRDWKETHGEIPGWGVIFGQFDEFIRGYLT